MDANIGINRASLVVAGTTSPTKSTSQAALQHESDEKKQISSPSITEVRQLTTEDLLSNKPSNNQQSVMNKNEGLDVSGVRILRHTNRISHDEVIRFAENRAEHGGRGVGLEILSYKLRDLTSDLKIKLESQLPTLQGEKYGISLDEKGDLTLVGDGINKSFNSMLNKLDTGGEIKNLAQQFVSQMASWKEVDEKFEGNGLVMNGIEVNRDNFSKMVDLSATIADMTVKAGSFHYLVEKFQGKLGIGDNSTIDEYINGTWVNIKKNGLLIDGSV